MRDIWSFLLQTLTASGAAVLVLAAKALFRDKLSPRWQCVMWGVLAAVLALPAGIGGRYVLVNWPCFVELLRTICTGEYGALAQVLAPVPLPPLSPPRHWTAWLYVLYAAGAALLLLRYMITYLRLRWVLHRGAPLGQAGQAQLEAVAARYGLPACPAVEVEGLSSAFVCGVLRPVLVLPAGRETDGKILLHELLHLKYRDAAWGMAICLLRCVHWCNPLLWYCANRAGNDLESLCDQRVLERLEGEERRDYGRILLSMADEKYARMPGTSSMANGGKNIRCRIEAIARFKKYPAGMALVSVCVVLVLAAPLVIGAQAVAVEQDGMGLFARQRAMASARTTCCTTYAGAMDAYAKAVIADNVIYRAMCAPLAEQAALAEELRLDQLHSAWPPESSWASGLPVPADHAAGYQIYNLCQAGDGCEGVLVVALTEPPAGEHPNGDCWLGFQSIRTEKEGDRWVVRPLEPFQAAVATGWEQGHIPHSCDQLPAAVYEAQAGDFTVRMRWQSAVQVDSYVESKDAVFGWMSPRSFDTTPQPGGSFSMAYVSYSLQAEYTGDESEKDRYTQIAAAAAPFTEMGKRPQMKRPGMTEASGGSSNGGFWGSRQLEEDWENLVSLGGGGTGGGDPWEYLAPERYAADFYLNRKLVAELTLLPVEGDGVHD